MAKKPTPLAGEATTTNYGWVKPTVGSSVDLWGGYINADLDSIDGVVHAIDTRPVGVTVSDTPPANPLVGQEWFDGVSGQLYVWYDDGNSSQWVIAVNATASLLPASTTVLGGVKVDGTTIQAASDGTISTTVVPLGDNRIINGDMRIDQRGVASGGGGTAVGYTVDRWQYIGTQSAKGAWVRSVANTNVPGFPYCFSFQSASAYTPLTADTFYFTQAIEADMISDFAWGTANAQPVTLSFWASSSLSGGVFSGALANAASNRSYPFTFTLPASPTWTRYVITIPGDTSGTWVMSGNAVSVYLRFDLGSGATYRAPANAWAGGNFVGANGAVNVVATNGAIFNVTGVKLEIGNVATPFNRQSLAKSMADCQRYYSVGGLLFQGYAVAGTIVQSSTSFAVAMRAAPTITGLTTSNSNVGSMVYSSNPGGSIAAGYTGVTAAGQYAVNVTFSFSAEL